MAQSPAHRFGQIIGDTLEGAIRPVLETVAKDLGMYLDGKGERKVRGTKRKVAWVDGKGNTHDLDYVFEAGGNAETIGVPRAFIEIAWRRYTKHSRNKAQEIQGAILPLQKTHEASAPFGGVVLAGIFTDGAVEQLRSHGFTVLLLPYATVVDAFATAGIDAKFDEATPDVEFAQKVGQWQALSAARRSRIARRLMQLNATRVDDFLQILEKSLTRRIEAVSLTVLHGQMHVFPTIDQAIAHILHPPPLLASTVPLRYEIQIRYGNGEVIEGRFDDAQRAIQFLRVYAP